MILSVASQVKPVEVSFSAVVYAALDLIVPLITNLRRLPVLVTLRQHNHISGNMKEYSAGWGSRGFSFLKAQCMWVLGCSE